MCSRERSCVLFFVNPARTCADTHVSLRPLVLTHLIPVIYRHYKLSKFAHPSPFRMRPRKVRRFEHFCSSSFVPESAGGHPRMQQHLRFSHPQPLTGVTPSVKPPPPTTTLSLSLYTVRHREMGTGISGASKRVPIFSFATQGGKQVSSHFRQRNWVQAREAQIRFPAG